MATEKAIMEVLVTFSQLFPAFGRDANVKFLRKYWLENLEGYSDEAVLKAMKTVTKTCTHVPTLAHLIDCLEEDKPYDAIGEQLWSEAKRGFEKASYQAQTCTSDVYIDPTTGEPSDITQREFGKRFVRDVYYSFKEELQLFFGNEQVFYSRALKEPLTDYDKARFLKALPRLCRTAEEKRLNLEAPMLVSRADEVRLKKEKLDKLLAGEITLAEMD